MPKKNPKVECGDYNTTETIERCLITHVSDVNLASEDAVDIKTIGDD
jgi:hypothetical protein